MRTLYVRNQDYKVFEFLDKALCGGVVIHMSFERAAELFNLNEVLLCKVASRHPTTFILQNESFSIPANDFLN